MPTYAVHYSYIEDQATRERIRPDHRAFLSELAERGRCLAAGAYAPGEQPGGLLIFRSESKDELARLLTDDPYQVNGIVTECRIIEWGPVIGPHAEVLR